MTHDFGLHARRELLEATSWYCTLVYRLKGNAINVIAVAHQSRGAGVLAGAVRKLSRRGESTSPPNGRILKWGGSETIDSFRRQPIEIAAAD